MCSESSLTKCALGLDATLHGSIIKIPKQQRIKVDLLERMETMRGEMETEMTRMHDDMEQQMRQFMREEDDEEDVL